MDAPWREPGWLATAHAWIDDQLSHLDLQRVGDIEQPHVYPWSTVLRVPTTVGNVWFKANDESLRHEAALVTMLTKRRPGLVPPLLAADLKRGWMLMTDAGEQLRVAIARERSLDRWLVVLPEYARLQLELADEVDTLLAMGVPDLRLETLPEKYEQLLHQIDVEPRFHTAISRVGALCDTLSGYGIAETIQHDDLHDGQIFIRDGRHVLLDWGDACVSHPFFTLSVTLEGVLAWGIDDVEGSVDVASFRDDYLAPFAEMYDTDLNAACEAALRLGWVCRAINGHIPGDEKQTHVRLRMFLDGHT